MTFRGSVPGGQSPLSRDYWWGGVWWGIPQPKKLNRDIVPLLETLSNKNDFFPLFLRTHRRQHHRFVGQLYIRSGVTHLADSFKYALDGFKNPAGIEANNPTILGAFSGEVLALRAELRASCTVLRSGWTLTCGRRKPGKFKQHWGDIVTAGGNCTWGMWGIVTAIYRQR